MGLSVCVSLSAASTQQSQRHHLVLLSSLARTERCASTTWKAMSGHATLLSPDEQAKAPEMPVAVAMPTAQVVQGQVFAAQAMQPAYAQPQQVQYQVQPVQYQQNLPQPSLGMDTLCSCFEDFGEACLCFWTCGCVSFGQTAERIGRTNCCAGGLMYTLAVVIIPYFFFKMLFADPPTAEQLNFPPCYHPPPMMGGDAMGAHSMDEHEMMMGDHAMHHQGKEDKYGMQMHNSSGFSSCPDGQLLDTQCTALNDLYNAWPAPFVQRAANAQDNYNRFCPSPQEAVGNVLGGLLSAAFLIHSRVHVAHALGITDDAKTKQFAATVYSLGTRGLLSCLFLALCLRHRPSQVRFSPPLSVGVRCARWSLRPLVAGFLLGPIAQLLGALLSIDLTILACGCWFCCVAQCQEHRQVRWPSHAATICLVIRMTDPI